MARKSPQEKKRISYAKDRRNAYGENDKSSRKAVGVNKRFPHRAHRHRVQQILQDGRGPTAEAEYDVEERIARRRPKRWQKEPDLPLGDWVENRLQRRLQLDGDRVANMRRLIRVQRRRRRRADAPIPTRGAQTNDQHSTRERPTGPRA